MSAADLAQPIRDALLANAALVALLDSYKGSFPVFTRRPAPAEVPYPIIMVSPDISINDQDGVNDFRPIQVRDVTVFGLNDAAENYRNVQEMGYMVRTMFHSERLSITVPGWSVIDISASGPIPAPTDDDKTIARLVSLTIQLARKAP